ncbi:hypothetical protein KCU62_g6747, partial [Aureobasidium sp. EXF-3399]
MLIPRWVRPIALVGLVLGFGTVIHLSSVFDKLRWDQIDWTIDPMQHTEDTNERTSSWTIPTFSRGSAKPPGSNYTRGLTIARMKHEDTSWVDEEDLDLEQYIYVVDDPEASLRVPQNKGHEAMVYLTYVIDSYDALPEISIFMHAHRYSHHNNAILDHDAAAMIRNLSSAKVIRDGYVNMRCNLDPGCPSILAYHGIFGEDKIWKSAIVDFLQELNPEQPLPKQMSQPCCAQFAVSRERIRETSLDQYIFYRDWLLGLSGSDHDTGRTWEYLWHYIFTGQHVSCPNEYSCYCEVYGICFESVGKQRRWFSIQEQIELLKQQMEILRAGEQQGDESEEFRLQHLMDSKIQELWSEGQALKVDALQRGEELQARAMADGMSGDDQPM